MRSYRPKTGPFLEGIYYEDSEFDEIATDELRFAESSPIDSGTHMGGLLHQ